MKYLQVVPTTSPIESWLHSQLEARGVDRVYSRYILSLFQSTDPVDQDFLDLDIPSKELKRLNKKSHHFRSFYSLTSSRRCLDPHHLIRASVIETLRSVAETKDSGIETLVDELCDRLNEKSSHSNSPSESSTPLSNAQSLNNVSLSVVDLAQKYYDAFPPLDSSNARQTSAALLLACCTSRPSPWNGKHKHLLSSSQSNLSSSKTLAGNRVNSVAKSSSVLSVGNLVDSSVEDKENQVTPDSKILKDSGSDSQSVDKMTHLMDRTASVKRKLFLEGEEAPSKDSVASLMEKVDGTKDLWGGVSDNKARDQSSTRRAAPFSLAPLSCETASLSSAPRSGSVPYGTALGFIPYNLTTSIWSEVEAPSSDGSSGMAGKWSSGCDGNDSGVCLASPPEELDETAAVIASGMTVTASATIQVSAVLNHRPEASAFRAVVPGSIPNTLPRYGSGLLTTSVPAVVSSGVEENLLTSSRTHFCPIEKAPHYKALLAETVQYTNGTTFSIASTMDEIDYQVGQDGTLTWDSSVYMEFKANGLTTECYNLYDPFKPKFRVSDRGDKAIQTEESDFLDMGMGYVQSTDIQEGEVDDYFFPGEESIARDIMRSLEEGDDCCPDDIINPPSLTPSPSDTSDVEPPRSKKVCSPLLVDAWAVAWPPFSIWSNSALDRTGDGWPTPSHDYQELSKGGKGDSIAEIWGTPGKTQPAASQTGLHTTNYSIWAPTLPLPLDTNSNLILCTTKCETPLPLGLGVNMGNLKISSDRKRRHSSSQYLGATTINTFPCIKSEAVSFFQQSITL